MDRKTKWFKTVFFILFGIVTISIGILICVLTQKTYSACTEETDAVIVDVAKSMSRSNKTFMDHYSYTPVFRYVYDGREYTSQMDVYLSFDETWRGKQCTIYVNPNDPKEICYREIHKISVAVYAVFFVIGGIVLLRGISLIVLLSRPIRQR